MSLPPSNLLPSKKLQAVSGRLETSEKISCTSACCVAISFYIVLLQDIKVVKKKKYLQFVDKT